MNEVSVAADGTQQSSVPEPSPLRRYPVEFTATTGEYFRIWIVNLALTIVTIGIYSAWAKVRKRRYLYSHTRIDGEGFDYRAKPLPILKGRLIAVALLAAYVASGELVPMFVAQPFLRTLVVIVFLAFAGPWILVRSFRFNAYNTAYRNIRLRFGATYGDCLRIVLVYGWLLLLPILYPYFKRRLVQFAAENHCYGGTRFVIGDFKKDFVNAYGAAYGMFLVVGLVMLASAFAVGASSGSRMPADVMRLLFTLTTYAAFVPILAYLRARTVNAVWNRIHIGMVSFQSTLRAGDLVGLYVGNVVAVLLTLGLATPWAVIRTLRYRASKTTVIASGPLDAFVQAEAQEVTATGEEVGEMFDIDVAL